MLGTETRREQHTEAPGASELQGDMGKAVPQLERLHLVRDAVDYPGQPRGKAGAAGDFDSGVYGAFVRQDQEVSPRSISLAWSAFVAHHVKCGDEEVVLGRGEGELDA
jgi:hypothetical protein